nr:zinc finger, CCHC-type [Tanacetum cinerariifolium]
MIILYELWTKKKPNPNYLRVWGCKAVVRLPDPKQKTLGERGIECIFIGYVEHFKAFRFYVIEPNDSVAINSITKTRDVIFDEHRLQTSRLQTSRLQTSRLQTSRLQMDLQKNLKVDGIVEKFKARLVIQGFKQKSMIDYFDTYAHSKNKYHLVIAMASIYNLIIHQIDVKTTILNGELEKAPGCM